MCRNGDVMTFVNGIPLMNYGKCFYIYIFSFCLINRGEKTHLKNVQKIG